jgi:hypothetical protein
MYMSRKREADLRVGCQGRGASSARRHRPACAACAPLVALLL